jgi:hypothetical protein
MGKLIDMLGKKYNRLTVISRAENEGTRASWHCLCDCGNSITLNGKQIRSGHTKSCGCYRKEVTAPSQGKDNTKHGQSRTKGYHRYHSRLREIAESRQCPKWADRAKIREIYVNRPDGCHVDHIIPLRGKKVSGLHVETNLQYLPIAENMRKHNTYHID